MGVALLNLMAVVKRQINEQREDAARVLIARQLREAFLDGVAAHADDEIPYEGDVEDLSKVTFKSGSIPRSSTWMRIAAKKFPTTKKVTKPNEVTIHTSHGTVRYRLAPDGVLEAFNTALRRVHWVRLETVDPKVFGPNGMRELAKLYEQPVLTEEVEIEGVDEPQL